MSVPPWTTSLPQRLRKWVTNRSPADARPSLTNAGTRLAIERRKRERRIRCQLLHPRSGEFSLTIDVLWLLKDLATCCSSLLYCSPAFCPTTKNPFLLYLFIPRGTIKVHKITSCVTSVLSWNTKCAISSKPGRTLHRGVLGDHLELMAFVKKAEELSYVALCSCGMEREQSRRRIGLDWWSP